MKKIKILLGLGFLSVLLVSFVGSHNFEKENEYALSLPSDILVQFEENLEAQAYTVTLNLDELQYIEEEKILDLKFDTKQYLPEDFNAYKGMIFEIEDIIYVEDQEDIDLGFNTEEFLPEGFNPYENKDLRLEEIIYFEQEEIDLGFDTAQYLPQGFDPYKGMNDGAL